MKIAKMIVKMIAAVVLVLASLALAAINEYQGALCEREMVSGKR